MSLHQTLMLRDSDCCSDDPPAFRESLTDSSYPRASGQNSSSQPPLIPSPNVGGGERVRRLAPIRRSARKIFSKSKLEHNLTIDFLYVNRKQGDQLHDFQFTISLLFEEEDEEPFAGQIWRDPWRKREVA